MTTPADKLASELAELRREVDALSRASQMSRRSIEGGGVQVFDTDGTLRGTIGIQDDGTTAVVTVNDPTPPTPSAPILFPVAGGLEITWDGTFVGNAPKPGDFRCVNIHAAVGTEPYSTSRITHRASLVSPGTFTVDLPEDAYAVVLVTETTGGTVSPPSVLAVETPAPNVDQEARDAASEALLSASGKVRYITSATPPAYAGDADTAVWRDSSSGYRLNRWDGVAWEIVQFGEDALQVGAVTADILSGTAIDGKTITGALVRTAADGQRVQLDSANGLVGYDATNVIKTQVDTDGRLTATDAVITGDIRAGAGQQVRISQVAGLEGGGVIELYPTDIDPDSAGGNGTPGELQAASDEFGMISALRSPGRVTDGASSVLILRALGTGVGEGVFVDSTGSIILRAGGDAAYNSIDLDGRTRIRNAAGALIDPLGYINAGTSGSIAPVAGAVQPPAGTPLHLKTYFAVLTANASGDTTVLFPGGAFPNGLLSLQVTTTPPIPAGTAPGPYTWITWGHSRSAVNLRCYNLTNGTVIASGQLGVMILAIGW